MHNKLIWIFQPGQIYTPLMTQWLKKIYIIALFSNPITSLLLRNSSVCTRTCQLPGFLRREEAEDHSSELLAFVQCLIENSTRAL